MNNDNMMFWDRKITRDEAKKILADVSHPMFIEYASILLSRTNEPKTIFSNYIKKLVFCRQWNKIKKQMRKNKWNDKKIVFWDEVYKVLIKHFNKDELKAPKEKQTAVDEVIRRIGTQIREARKAKGWTQQEFAKKAGFSQQTVSFVERGYINVSFLTLKKLIDALGLKISISEENDRPFSTFTS
ncbi:MAG: helix-turn-helix transcriptional regulator [Candidatus Omnitrophica bacterium]|nr:helix-turn-helix transcriptional regulator [Candidatus Omnitrophota bacterium]